MLKMWGYIAVMLFFAAFIHIASAYYIHHRPINYTTTAEGIAFAWVMVILFGIIAFLLTKVKKK